MPDSEANKWLEKIQQSQKGKLKIHVGMSAGVGKSYRMLQEAHTLLRNGGECEDWLYRNTWP